MRVFIGLPAPEGLLPALSRIQSALPIGRAVPEENLHLTLAFLGDVAERAIEDLHDTLDLRRLERCQIVADGLATYGGAKPKLLALDVRAQARLVALQATVARAVAEAGLHLERRRFRPHITLFRYGSGLQPAGEAHLRRALSGLTLPEIPPEEARLARLYTSHLEPNGARYETLAEYLLA